MIPVHYYDDLCALLCALVGKDRYARTVRECRLRYDDGLADTLERIFAGDRGEELHGGEVGAEIVSLTPERARLLIAAQAERERAVAQEELPTPDPFSRPEALLVTAAPAGTSLAQITHALTPERVDAAEFVAVENPDRTIRLLSCPIALEPRGRGSMCVPRSVVPGDALHLDYGELIAIQAEVIRLDAAEAREDAQGTRGEAQQTKYQSARVRDRVASSVLTVPGKPELAPN